MIVGCARRVHVAALDPGDLTDTPPPVFSEKRLQTIENKGNECRKVRKETTKRLQADANKRVGVLERSKEGKSATQRAQSAEHRDRRWYTSVATGSMRKLLRVEAMRALRGAYDGDDARHGGQAGSCLVSRVGSEWWVVSRGGRKHRREAGRRGRSFEICAGTGTTMGKGSARVLEK